MSNKQLSQLTKVLEKLEQDLRKSVLSAHNNHDKVEDLTNRNIEKIEKILENSLNLKEKLIVHSSKRPIFGKFLDKIRGRFYKEIDDHFEEVIANLELSSRQNLNYLKILRHEIERLQQKNADLESKITNLKTGQ